MKNLSSHKKSAFAGISRSFFVSLLLIISTCMQARADEAQFTQNMEGRHTMSFQVPLATYPGRGVSLPVTLTYSTRNLWRIDFMNGIPMGSSVWRSVTEAIYAEHSTAGWTTSLDVPRVEWPKQNDVYWYTGKPYPRGTLAPFTYRVAQLFMHMPNGAVHLMRKQDAVYADSGFIDMTGTFYAVDGTRLRYDSAGPNTGTLYMPDGGRYVLGTTTVQHIDRNGNTLIYDISSRVWTDTMGRQIGMPWPANPGPGQYSYVLPGVNGEDKTYTLKFQPLSSTLSIPGQSLKAMGDYYLPDPASPPTGPSGSNFPQPNSPPSLFHSGYSDIEETSSSYTYVVGRGQSQGSLFDPTVLAEIVLPTGQSYKFSYNINGEMDKVIYPTGGYERYQYSSVVSINVARSPYTQASRGVRSRWVSPTGSSSDETPPWQYSANINPLIVTAPDGTRTETYLFTFPQSPTAETFGYRDSRHGMVKEERVYAPGPEGAMLRRTLYDYAQSSATINKPTPNGLPNSGTYTASRNVRLTKQVSLVLDTGGHALAKTQTYEYTLTPYEFSVGLDRTAATETHFQTVLQSIALTGLIAEIPAGTTAKKVETVYLDNSAYRNRNILGLATSVTVKGVVSGFLQNVAKTNLSYDEIGYPLLTYTDLTTGYTDPGAAPRGNVTTTTRYVDAAATIPISTHAQYDQCGSLRKNWNERGMLTETEYAPAYKRAYATKVTTPIPDPLGGHGSNAAFESSSTFDFTSGLPLTKTDANGQVTTYEYKDDENVYDDLNRLRKVIRPDGGWTKYTYGDSPGNLFRLTETKQDATRIAKSYQYFDPLGRASRSFSGESGNNYIATDTIFDVMGRVWKVSNAYRTTTLDGVADLLHTSDWTISAYDPLGRVVSLTLPDGSVVQTSYQGEYTTVTDQAGKQRRQKTDALGRIIRVDEPNSSGSLGTVDSPTQPTSYDYDTQGNLVHVAQGSSPVQHRYFKYDALGRPTHERQVEQAAPFTVFDPVTGNNDWSRKLIYDETYTTTGLTETYTGLLTSSYDARNVETKFRYDQLNRIYKVTYSDSTPAITNNYDQVRNGFFNNGHLTEALTAAVSPRPSTALRYNFDLMGRTASSEQTVDTQTYVMEYGYDLADTLTSQKYPSGRIVTYAFDDAARLSQVSSGSTVYASQFDYTSSNGALKSVTLGNGAVESYVYNSRSQLLSQDVTKDGVQLQHYDLKYGVYDPATNTLDESKNNGQIAQIEGLIGTQKQWQQRFTYDEVGRLSSAREIRGDTLQQSYLANYAYDVFGNRYQKQTQNSSNPFTQVWVEDGQIDLATNRFIATTGVTYDDAGNVITDSKFRNRKFEYDANNRQKQSRNLDNSGAVDSVFDATGQRVATQVGSSLTNVLVYDAFGKLVAEYSSTIVLGGTQYIFDDQQGTPRTTTNNQGTVIARHDYLPFGEDMPNSVGMRATTPGYGGTDAARQKYAGMERDEATGMSHTLWRKFDSASARWTSPDPYGGSMTLTEPQSFNRYTYVNNDPVNKVDPTGLALSDIGVYQTTNTTVATIVYRIQARLIANHVSQRSGRQLTSRDRSRAALNQSLNAAVDRALGFNFGEIAEQNKPKEQQQEQQTTREIKPSLAWIGDVLKGRDASTDQAPTNFPFIWWAIEQNFRDAVTEIDKKLKSVSAPHLQFTEMFRTTARQKMLREKYERGESSIYTDPPGESTHECGCSFDVKRSLYTDPQFVIIVLIFERHGFIQNVENDDVHFTWRSAAAMRDGKSPTLKQWIHEAQVDFEIGRFRRRE